MSKVTFNIRSLATMALLAGGILLGANPSARAQTFETVLNTNLFQPAGISISPQNQYIISDTADHRIVEFNPDNRVFKVLAGPERAPFEPGAVDGQGIDARFRNPQGILCVGDRTFVADSGNHVIREIDRNGNVRTIAGNLALAHEVDDFGGMPMNWGLADGPALSAQFNAPSGLASDGLGHLFIADSGNRAIRMLDLNNNTVSTLVRQGLTSPVAVTLGLNGSLFISDAGAHCIKIWKPGDVKAALLAGGGNALARGFRNSTIATNALFSAPAGIYYREVSDELIVADSGNGVLRTIQGASGAAPKVDTFANTTAAGFQTPIAVTRDLYGVFVVADSTRNLIASVITVRFPRIEKPRVGYLQVVLDPTTGLPIARLVPVTDGTFDNMLRIAVAGDPTAEHHFTQVASVSDTVLPELPTTNSTTVPNFKDPASPAPPEDELNNVSLNSAVPPRYNFALKVFSAPKGLDERIPSLVTDAIFRFKCATPQLDSQSLPGRLLFRCNTTNATVYYTLDGTEPIKGVGSVKALKSGDSIPLILTTNLIQVKARAYLDDRFIPSDVAKAEFSPENFVPNRIGLGFEDGEASTRMRGAPGQRFFAPVTLSLMPGARAYGLQFDLSLEPRAAAVSSDYRLAFDSTLVEKGRDTNRIIPPAVFVLAGTNFVTNFVTEISTNFTYQVALTNYSPEPVTNYLSFTNRLADVVPVITTTFITNLGQSFPLTATNYVTNSFQLVSDNSVTKITTEINTNYLYRYLAPSVTNIVRVDSRLPESSEMIVTNFVSNLGQLFSFNTTNYITNSFNLVSEGMTTNSTPSVEISYAYQAVSPAITNFVSLSGFVPEDAQIIVTNFVTNLGQVFPVTSTNMLTNSFDLVSVSLLTNANPRRETNYAYRSFTPGVTNFLTLDTILADSTPVVVTNFVENMGLQFPIVTTNYISNAFNLLAVEFATNVTHAIENTFIYETGTAAQTNILILDRVLAESTKVITTNFLPNLGEKFPILSTNYITNAFNLVSAKVETNALPQVTSHYLYEVTTPGRTSVVVLDHLLADSTVLLTTNFIPNMGDQFPVVTTNFISNSFNLFSVDVVTNNQPSFSTNFAYRSVTPGKTNLITVNTVLPDRVPLIVTNFIENLGKQFPIVETNYITNAFDLVSSEFIANVVSDVTTSLVYRAISTPTTSYVTLDHFLPDTGPVVALTTATNLGLNFVMSSTNIARNVFEFVSAEVTTNVVNYLSYEYGYPATNYVNRLLWPGPIADSTTVLITNTITVGEQRFAVTTTNIISSADLAALVLDGAEMRYLYALDTFLPAGALVSTNQVSVSGNITIEATGYVAGQDRTFSQEFVTILPNPIFSTNTNLLARVDIVTNVVYRLKTPSVTNYVTLSTNLPDVAPVVSSATVTNLGQTFTVAITNYATNVFDLVSTSFKTNVHTDVITNVTYALRSPAVTNLLNLATKLPDAAPVVTTTFLTNLGQVFPISTTNYVANSFEFLGETHSARSITSYSTNVVYLFTEPARTNYVFWPELLPDRVAVVTTNFVSNLGREFPVVQSNYLTNTFHLISQVFETNRIESISTNIVYEFRTLGSTNYLYLANRLPDQVPVITTNFVDNLGQLFPIAVTNYLTNTFRLIGISSETNDLITVITNVAYSFVHPGVTNYLNLAEKLPAFKEIVSTNFIGNLGQVYPVVVTNVVFNEFEFLGTNFLTHTDSGVTTNVLYALRSPRITNIVMWPVKLPDFVTVISTNFITNLAQVFPVNVTNTVANLFQLLYTNYYTNVAIAISTNIFYEFHTSALTNFFELDAKLPEFAQVISTNFVTNLGQLFPVRATNFTANVFDLISTNVSTNRIVEVSPNYLYAVVSPGTGPGLPVSVKTNLVTLDDALPQVVPIVTTVGFVTNLTQVFPVFATNYTTNTFRLVQTSYITNTVQVSRTNTPSVFADLVITNYSQNFLAVGWIEHFGQTNLYNTKLQDLLSYSQPHNSVFEGLKGEAVAGAFSFVIPTNAVNGDQYTVRLSRPSATADGVSQDMFIQAPDESDTSSPIKAVRTLQVTNHVGYIVGDVSDFRWFNAGDFGDGSIVNNDLTELQQVIVYGLNLPPADSDFLDAMDTCCYTADGRDLSSMQYASGATIDLNSIAFGDGSRFAPLGNRPNAKLEVNDLFLAFHRSLEPDLVWYERYWSNGVRQARSIPNTFRVTKSTRKSTVSALSLPSAPTIQSDVTPSLTLYAGTVSGMPGVTVAVPIHARVEGGFPLRTLMFNARVEMADGTLLNNFSVEATAMDPLGAPDVLLNNEPGHSGAAWLNTSVAGVLGDQVVARVLFQVPLDAQPTTLYYVKLDRVSGSPNGISLFPVRSGNGLVAMANRPTPVWNDGIPDAWRIQYFGTLSDMRSAADVDADGDGLSNYEEFKLGTNPLDPSDNLRVQAAANGRGVKVKFHTSSGRTYRIEGSSSLQPGTWIIIQSDVPGTGNDLELPAPGGAHSFYYRVLLQD